MNILPLQAVTRDACACVYCGRRGNDGWMSYHAGSRIAVFRACLGGCFSGLLRFLSKGGETARLLLEGYRLYPILNYQTLIEERIQMAKAKLPGKDVPSAKGGKSVKGGKSAKSEIAELNKLLKTAKPITGKTPLKKQADLVGRWHMYREVTIRQGSYGEYALCRIVEVTANGKAIKGEPFTALLNGSRLLPVLKDKATSTPFLARIEKGENAKGKPYYYFV